MDERTQAADSVAPAPQPSAVIERDGVRYTLLGTAHVSRSSADEVERQIASGSYDVPGAP
jgi:pheromone shutdown protein TraB